MNVEVYGSMIDQTDAQALRIVRSELTKRSIDTSRADVRVLKGICHIRGMISAPKSSGIADLNIEIEHIGRILRQKPGIREVILEVSTVN